MDMHTGEGRRENGGACRGGTLSQGSPSRQRFSINKRARRLSEAHRAGVCVTWWTWREDLASNAQLPGLGWTTDGVRASLVDHHQILDRAVHRRKPC